MKIEVTQQDIDQGIRKSCARCPVALALRRHFPIAEVGFRDIALNVRCVVLTPDSVREFICRFDRSLSVEPFSFELEVPDEDQSNSGRH